MYGIYDDIIGAAEKATEAFSETEELLEYPEVQADKAYYLSVLKKYNELKIIVDKLAALKKSIASERDLAELLSEAEEKDREAIYEEMSALRRASSEFAATIADALGCKHVTERAYCRFKFTAGSSKFGTPFASLIKQYLLDRGVSVSDERSERKGATVTSLSFTCEGEDIITSLTPLTGAHKVFIPGAKSEEVCFAVTPAEGALDISDKDLKIDVFHSSGAGGQNINKVETAVRVTHIPSGLVVTCQDERSQLANKKRAIENIKARLGAKLARDEKTRMDADIYSQFRKKNTPISFDGASSTMTDARLKSFSGVPFPLADFKAYIDGLMVRQTTQGAQ